MYSQPKGVAVYSKPTKVSTPVIFWAEEAIYEHYAG
jgi:hypothetical protein